MKSLAFLISLVLSGCVSVAPNLKLPEKVPCPTEQPPPTPPAPCPKLKMPPVAQQVYIKIDGNKIEADAGGEELIRYYVKAQSLLR